MESTSHRDRSLVTATSLIQTLLKALQPRTKRQGTSDYRKTMWGLQKQMWKESFTHHAHSCCSRLGDNIGGGSADIRHILWSGVMAGTGEKLSCQYSLRPHKNRSTLEQRGDVISQFRYVNTGRTLNQDVQNTMRQWVNIHAVFISCFIIYRRLPKHKKRITAKNGLKSMSWL